jgi:hypothetical protein
LNVLFQGPFFKSQYDFNKVMNRRAKQSNLQATYKYAKGVGNEVPIGRPIVKAQVRDNTEWLGLKLTVILDRQDINDIMSSRATMMDFLDKFESTNILIATNHLN